MTLHITDNHYGRLS